MRHEALNHIKSLLNVTSVATCRDIEGFVQPPGHHGQWPTFDGAVAGFLRFAVEASLAPSTSNDFSIRGLFGRHFCNP